MLSRLTLALLAPGVAFSFAGCSGSPSSPISGVGFAPVRASSHARGTSATSCLSTTCIYVTDGHAKRPFATVAVFAGDANGDVPPLSRLRGMHTELDRPMYIAVDATHREYVTDRENQSITVYASGAQGNVPPVQQIVGSNTGLFGAAGIGVDVKGRIYVANYAYPTPRVSVFAAGANGNVAPIRSIAGSHTGLAVPFGLAVDDRGAVYVTNSQGGSSYEGSVTVYAPGAKGDATPRQTIGGPDTGLAVPIGVAVDAHHNIYVTNLESSVQDVTVYAAGATGDAAPIRTIQGSYTNLYSPVGIAVDDAGTLYVTNVGAYQGSVFVGNGITVYAPGANGNVAPIRTIAGSAATLNNPGGIAVR